MAALSLSGVRVTCLLPSVMGEDLFLSLRAPPCPPRSRHSGDEGKIWGSLGRGC